MQKNTSELLEYLKRDKSKREVAMLRPLIYSIVKCGDNTDADAILTQYLSHPTDFHYSYLLLIFKAFGNHSMAEQIFNVSFHQGKLNENTDAEILEVLGCLKYEPIKQILATYIFEHTDTDYYISKYAVLGLLHFDCEAYQDKIEKAIENCYGKNLFPEFIPALVCKVKNKKTVLEKLYELGCEHASTDCNAGIILGFSLCGEEGKHYFRKVLFDRNWETSSTGTGTVYFAYEGLKKLDITFKELYLEIKTISDKDKLAYCIDVLFALLRRKIEDIEINPIEQFSDIYTALFQWKNKSESDTVTDLAARVDKTQEVYEIEKCIELKMIEEALLRNYKI
ncbi:MAG: hypothetical protein R2807_11390 [Chitinophagales bacterium]